MKDGEMNDELADNLELCMHLRHDADYGLIYDQESAEAAIRYAKHFLSVVKKTSLITECVLVGNSLSEGL